MLEITAFDLYSNLKTSPSAVQNRSVHRLGVPVVNMHSKRKEEHLKAYKEPLQIYAKHSNKVKRCSSFGTSCEQHLRERERAMTTGSMLFHKGRFHDCDIYIFHSCRKTRNL